MSGSDFELVAASLRADATDVRAFVEALAAKLEGALPTVEVDRRGGGLLGGRKRVAHIAVRLGQDAYELDNDDGRVTCRRRTVVRGIALKNDELSLDEWLDAISGALVEEASQSERARTALERLLDA